MKRFVEGIDRSQTTLFPECLEDWIDEDNPVRVIDVFVGGLDLAELRFCGVDPEATGRPSYRPSVLLRLAELREDNGSAIRKGCSQLVAVWPEIGRLASDRLALDRRK